MTQYISWRWVFWATSIFDGAVQIVSFVLLKETHHPTILKKKAMALRKSTGNEALHTKWQGPDHSMKKILMKSLIRPFIMLTTQPALQAMSLFRGFQYGIMYLVFSTIPRVFEGSYNQDVGRASLNYLSLGVGFVIGLQISGRMQDKVSRAGLTAVRSFVANIATLDLQVVQRAYGRSFIVEKDSPVLEDLPQQRRRA